MQVTHDKKLLISIGRSRKAAQWQNREMLWSEFLDKLANTTRTRETVNDYAAMTKAERDNVKDVGGFVGGYVHVLHVAFFPSPFQSAFAYAIHHSFGVK